jgi:hypothetical protein
MNVSFGPWARGISPAERLARLRAIRALAMLLCGGPEHPLCLELLAAERDEAALPRALALLDDLAPLPRRRLLASYAALAAASPALLDVPKTQSRRRASAVGR